MVARDSQAQAAFRAGDSHHRTDGGRPNHSAQYEVCPSCGGLIQSAPKIWAVDFARYQASLRCNTWFLLYQEDEVFMGKHVQQRSAAMPEGDPERARAQSCSEVMAPMG